MLPGAMRSRAKMTIDMPNRVMTPMPRRLTMYVCTRSAPKVLSPRGNAYLSRHTSTKRLKLYTLLCGTRPFTWGQYA